VANVVTLFTQLRSGQKPQDDMCTRFVSLCASSPPAVYSSSDGRPVHEVQEETEMRLPKGMVYGNDALALASDPLKNGSELKPGGAVGSGGGLGGQGG